MPLGCILAACHYRLPAAGPGVSLGLLAASCGEWDQAGRIHPGKVTHIAGAACGRLLWLQVIAPCSLRMRDPAVENSVEAFYLLKQCCSPAW